MTRFLAYILLFGAILFIAGCQTNNQNINDESTSTTQTDKFKEDIYLSESEVENGLDLQNNGKDGKYVVNLLNGDFTENVEGTILSDTDCEPDSEGVSRCLSYIRLSNQSLLEIATPHNMKNYRCFQINETVTVSRNDNSKVIVTVHNL